MLSNDPAHIKKLFFILLAFLVIFTIAMMRTRESGGDPGKTQLVWVTDKNPLRDEQIALFSKLHPKVEINMDPSNGDAQKVIVQSLAGVGPDVFDYWGDAAFDSFIRSGVALDLTDELSRRGIIPARDWWPLAIPWTVTPQGRVYGVPANVGINALWLDRDKFNAADVPLPKDNWSLQDLIETAQKLTIRGKDGSTTQYGLLFDFGDAYRSWLPSFGGSLFDTAGTKCTLDSPESVACLTFIDDLIYKYKVSPSPDDEQSITTVGDWGGLGAMAYFRKGLGAMAVGGRWWLAQLRGDVRDHGLHLGSVTLPIAKFPHFNGGGARAVMVNSLSRHRSEAIDFVAFLAQEDYGDLLNDQADALAALRRLAYTDRYLHNPRDPGQDIHGAFRKMLEMGVPLTESPYVEPTEVDDLLNAQLDLVKLHQKTPWQGLHDATANITRLMKRNIERDSALRARFLAAGGNL
jgi:multiple sugar transport system substrate-binding protein